MLAIRGRAVRITIGSKVFGVSLLLVLLMSMAALLSSYLVRDVNFGLIRVNDTYIPLSRAVAEVEAYQLEQELVTRSLIAELRDPTIDEEMVERGLQNIKDRGQKVDAAIAEAHGLINAARADERYDAHLVELVELDALVQAIEREHQDFQDESLRLIDVLRQGNREVNAALLAFLQTEEREFDDQVDKAVVVVSRFTRKASAEALEAERRVYQANLVLTALAALAGLLLTAGVVRGMVRPVHALVDATQQIERGNLEIRVDVRSRDEIGQLARSFNHMAGELRVKEQIKDTFGRYVDPRIVEGLLDDPDGVEGAGEREICTVFFSDIAGFTPLAEMLTPSAVVRLMNGYFTEMSAPIRGNKGIIDKYIGDAIMAFWGPPFTGRSEHARLACLSALAQRDLLAEFQTQLPDLTGLRQGVPVLDVRVGIATGDVIIGSVGSDVSKNYTVMGDTVNLAARLEGLNKQYGTRILISGETEALARDAIEAREIDLVAVVGKSEPIRIYELLAPRGGLAPKDAIRRDRFEAALVAYRSRDWAAARDGFAACEDDPAAAVFLQRVEQLAADPPDADWGGVWQAATK